MTLEEAIKHCEEIAENLSAEYDCYMNCGEQGEHVERCLKCAAEHRQLAEWLKELKERRTQDAHDTNDWDLISRRAAIKAAIKATDDWDGGYNITRANMIEKELNDLPSAQPESTRTFVELVVRYPDPELCAYKEYKGKPYYSIKYIENGETHVGYGTYNPEVLSQYLKEYFISSAQSEIVRCKDCKHWRQQTNCQDAPLSFGFCESDDMWRSLYGETTEVSHIDTDDDFYCGYAERRTDD